MFFRQLILKKILTISRELIFLRFCLKLANNDPWWDQEKFAFLQLRVPRRTFHGMHKFFPLQDESVRIDEIVRGQAALTILMATRNKRLLLCHSTCLPWGCGWLYHIPHHTELRADTALGVQNNGGPCGEGKEKRSAIYRLRDVRAFMAPTPLTKSSYLATFTGRGWDGRMSVQCHSTILR